MKQLFTFLYCVVVAGLLAQAPQSIPYQAVVRNTDGSVMADAAMTITFKIHDATATGNVVYEESHATTTNPQGLISLNVGNGVAVSGTFSSINWGSGNKFLHVLMNAGNGAVDLGTQQMMSVPYALYAEEVSSFVSPTGDTLSISGNSIIVPGISSENIEAQYMPGSGVSDIQGNFYPSVIINGQEWMQKNLNVLQYRNGDPIPFGASANWNSSDSIGSLMWNWDVQNGYWGGVAKFGRLYNWHAVNDERGLCPSGWHVPSDAEWTSLITFLGGSEFAGGRLKSNSEGWVVPNTGATNSSGFSALGGGYGQSGSIYQALGFSGNWWSSTERPDFNASSAWFISVYNNTKISTRSYNDKEQAFSVRCLKD